MNVVVTGSLGFDYIMNFSGRFADRIMPDKIHKISLSFLADKMTKHLGGTSGNISYGLRLLGVDPCIVTSAGHDFFEYKQFLVKQRIDISGIKQFSGEPCSVYHVVTDQDDNQIGAYYIGASRYNKTLSVRQKKKPDIVVIGPTDPLAMKKYIIECQKLRYEYMFDPAFQIDSFSTAELRDGISRAKILIGNDYEIALIKQKLKIGVPVLITTLGAKGSVIETQHESIHVKPAKPKNVSDPTGAGDAYRAGFLAGYLRHFDLQVCGQMGSVAAAYTVEKYGTQTHHFTKKEFIKRYKDNYSSIISL